MNDYDFLREHFAADPAALEMAIRRYETGTPCAYLTGEQFFYRHAFFVNENVLIPRSDTERVVEEALGAIRNTKNPEVADLCTGSGCIGLTILDERRDSSCLLVDISDEALAVARKNARRLHLSDRAEFLSADVLSDDPLGTRKFDLIVSNPPYITRRVLAELPLLRAEPQIALDGGEDGLTFYRVMTKNLKKNLKKDARIVYEIGFDQRKAIETIAEENGFSCQIVRDYGGNDRTAILKSKDFIE